MTSVIKGQLRPIKDKVLVSHMYFGEQKTKSGLIIKDDNGTTRGIYPRWGKVYDKGPDNKDQFQIGDWILVMHGRWTRGVKVDTPSGEIELRKVDLDSILATSSEKPSGLRLGAEYTDGQEATIDPGSFING